MSGSPKYSYASLAEDRRRQAQEERERRAAEEAARRAAEEARLAIERRDRLREEAGTQAVSLLRRLSALESEAGSRFVPSGTAGGLRGNLQQATEEARGAATEPAARTVQRRVSELAVQFDRLATQVRTAARAADQLGSEVAEAEAELDRIASAASARHVLPAGATSGWSESLGRVRQSVAAASDAEGLRRIATELSGVRAEIRRAGADAEAAQQDAVVAGGELRKLTDDIDTFARGPLRPHAEPGRVEALEGTAAQLTEELDHAAGRAAVAEVRRGTAAAADELHEVTEAAAATQRSAHLAAEAQVLARLRGEVGGLDVARCQKFDATGWADLQAKLATSDRHLGRGELELGRTALAAARSAFDAHRTGVARRFQQWQLERDRAVQALAEARSATEAVRRDARRVRFIATPLHDLDRRLSEADRQIGREEFAAARPAAQAVAQEAARLGTLADQLASEADRLTELRTRAAGAQPVAGRTFDSNGARDTARYLDAAETAIKGNKLTDAQQQLDAARDRLTRHEQAARDAAEQWQKEHDEATTALAAGRARLETLRADPVVGKWQPAALADWEKALTQAAAELAATRGDLDLDRPRFASARKAAANLSAAEAKLAAEANALQVQADLQMQIGTGVLRVMEELGFAVAGGLQDPADPRSAILLQASRDNGDMIDVAVEHEGKIEYTIGGRLESKTDVVVVEGRDKKVRRCDQAEEQILRMHEMLAQLGIETSELSWPDKPPPDDTAVEASNPALAVMRQNQQRKRTADGKK